MNWTLFECYVALRRIQLALEVHQLSAGGWQNKIIQDQLSALYEEVDKAVDLMRTFQWHYEEK